MEFCVCAFLNNNNQFQTFDNYPSFGSNLRFPYIIGFFVQISKIILQHPRDVLSNFYVFVFFEIFEFW